MQERLQKIFSQQGIASRRKAEEYIEQGLVKVNGKVAKMGDKADPFEDEITFDGKILQDRANMLYYLMNKPTSVETKNIPGEDEKTVRDLLPKKLQGKVYPVGRLDKDSSGLLLFTNDGVLAFRLTHPKFTHEKEYEITVDRPISSMVCRKIEQGFEMDGSQTKPLKAKKVGTNVIHITLTEGKNRQIRRMLPAVGFTVKRLKRIRIMTLSDSKLQMGKVRELTEMEKKKLLQSVGL